VKHDDDGSVTLSFRVDRRGEFTPWLLGWSGWVQHKDTEPGSSRAVFKLHARMAIKPEGD